MSERDREWACTGRQPWRRYAPTTPSTPTVWPPRRTCTWRTSTNRTVSSTSSTSTRTKASSCRALPGVIAFQFLLSHCACRCWELRLVLLLLNIYCVCVGDADNLLLSTHVCVRLSLCKQARSNWNFKTVCRMVSIHGRLLFAVIWHKAKKINCNVPRTPFRMTTHHISHMGLSFRSVDVVPGVSIGLLPNSRFPMAKSWVSRAKWSGCI